MKIYLISQNENDDYDTYDSAVVYAKDEKEVRKIHPSGRQKEWRDESCSNWCDKPSQVEVKYIGEAPKQKKKGVILSSFNAG